MRPDLLCTEGLLESGVVDLVFNRGWYPPTLEALSAAQHGYAREGMQTVPLPNTAVISCFLSQFPYLVPWVERYNPTGRYILIVRDGDPSIRDGGGPNCNVREWPSFIHHVFGINVLEGSSRVTPMPGAFWAFWNYSAPDIPTALDIPRSRSNRVVVCHRYDGGGAFRPGHERLTSVDYFRTKSWATVHPKMLTMQGGPPLDVCHLWPHAEFLAQLRAHDYHAVPIGYGVERTAPWEAMALGTIPIVRKHPEYLHFADMPFAFVDNWEDVTEDWCDANLGIAERSTEKLKLSYWVERIREKRSEL